jgi:hypothetical protein
LQSAPKPSRRVARQTTWVADNVNNTLWKTFDAGEENGTEFVSNVLDGVAT